MIIARSLACFGPVGRRTSHRIGIASPAASKIGCTRRRNHAYRSPTCTYAVTARNPSMAGTVPNRTCRRVRCTWFLPEVDTETLALLFVSRGRDRATGRDNQATQEGARERLSAPSPPASSLPAASSQPIDASGAPVFRTSEKCSHGDSAGAVRQRRRPTITGRPVVDEQNRIRPCDPHLLSLKAGATPSS